jgi:predicted ATPase/class 3 adenylate cyclase
LLFSDVEGSTVLLSRLGAAYAEALDGQRQVLRKAWAEHGGIELGTEGDSFYVVFSTAPDAVTAAAQAQHELSTFQWPAGEHVRVRMGIHTGNPTVHDGAYVGMDVHRAARIAGSAHGGQVVISEATAKLAGGRLPEKVVLRDLGSHQLKDIPQAEHLFQLAIDGLSSEFPPIKTLGAASILPRPATPLVGRDGELAELSALMRSPDVRLVTLTGPGGSGKTRLAVALAQGLVERFPDGVFFVPLAAVTTADVMWTSIAEVLDVPPEGRIPPGFFDHVAQRSALFVLDNLEQIDGADTVVAELLDHAPQAVAVATSRKPLAVAAEHVHPVPPLELPEGTSQTEAEASGAVQLFVQHAQKVKPAFRLTTDNAAQVTEICRRLDGLPLAIELAAARARALSPAALLARLDKALDIAASGQQAPSRQKTLRGTIAWSYDLLNPTKQAFFRRLGVFAGGADLDAITAVTADILNDADPLDLALDLMDASLATITDDAQGEPRIGMLETIRAYALDTLRGSEELDQTQRLHAEHFLPVAEQLSVGVVSGGIDQLVGARTRFELELDNFREAIRYTLEPNETGTRSPQQLLMGLRLCAELSQLWHDGGYVAEGRRWLDTAIKLAGDEESPELSRCLAAVARLARTEGEYPAALDAAARAVAIGRRLADSQCLTAGLMSQANTYHYMNDLPAARRFYQEARVVARESGDDPQLARAMAQLSIIGYEEGDFERSLELAARATDLYRRLGNEYNVLTTQHNMACARRAMGRPHEAHRQMAAQLTQMVQVAEPELLLVVAEDYGAVLVDLGAHRWAIRLLGAADAGRERNGTPRDLAQQAEIDNAFRISRAALPPDTWNTEYEQGRSMTVEDALGQARAATDHEDSDAGLTRKA